MSDQTDQTTESQTNSSPPTSTTSTVSWSSIVRPAEWHGLVGSFEYQDKISVHNLNVVVNAGTDAWGRQRPQPALISVSLSLAKSFDSAAESDKVDRSTVHYGILAKNLKALIENYQEEHVDTCALVRGMGNCIEETAGGIEKLRAYEIDFFYPKASLHGDGVGLWFGQLQNLDGTQTHSTSIYLRNVRVPCLIGVNANERLHTQPVIANLWIETPPNPILEDKNFTPIDEVLKDTILSSVFETLESLSMTIVENLNTAKFLIEQAETGEKTIGFIRLKLSKPMAVPFADAPSIEVVRPFLQ